jgi:hypothetical protein
MVRYSAPPYTYLEIPQCTCRLWNQYLERERERETQVSDACTEFLQHSFCLSLLADYLKPGNVVLDVGSGSGYLTAVFGLMVLLSDHHRLSLLMLINAVSKFTGREISFCRLARLATPLELSTFPNLWSDPLTPSE